MLFDTVYGGSRPVRDFNLDQRKTYFERRAQLDAQIKQARDSGQPVDPALVKQREAVQQVLEGFESMYMTSPEERGAYESGGIVGAEGALLEAERQADLADIAFEQVEGPRTRDRGRASSSTSQPASRLLPTSPPTTAMCSTGSRLSRTARSRLAPSATPWPSRWPHAVRAGRRRRPWPRPFGPGWVRAGRGSRTRAARREGGRPEVQAGRVRRRGRRLGRRRKRGQGWRGPEKTDLEQVDAVARKLGMTEEERNAFGRHIEEEKAKGEGGSQNDRGDYSYRELLALGRSFLEEHRNPEAAGPAQEDESTSPAGAGPHATRPAGARAKAVHA